MCLVLGGCVEPPPAGDETPGGSDPTPAPDFLPDGVAADAPDRGDPPKDSPRFVVLMIGDGMGLAHIDAASGFRHGARGALAMQDLPVQARVHTGGPSGITDSAASATAMASGVFTYNQRVGFDRDGTELESLVDLADALGLGSGVVTTATIAHATPGAFTAHENNRESYGAIAAQQVRQSPVQLLLGGGVSLFDGSVGEDLWAEAEAGRTVITEASQLADAPLPLLGIFAPEHLDYEAERPDTQPSLETMAEAALDKLGAAHPDGFFLMIEGARIDMASHESRIAEVVGETLAFDDAVAAVRAWLQPRNGTLLVTADHECGGLELHSEPEAGVLPEATWRWSLHTNRDVLLFGEGPGADVLDERLVDHRAVHAVLRSTLTGEPHVPPGRVLVPDGRLGDLRHEAAVQTNPTSFGEGMNQLDALWVDADERGLAVGIEGRFEFGSNAVVVLIDVDYGAGTGPASMHGAVSDSEGFLDSLIGGLSVTAPPAPGFGVDYVFVAHGGYEAWADALNDQTGLRRLEDLTDLSWSQAAATFGEGVRGDRPPGEHAGLEAFIPWDTLYAEPPTAPTLALAAVLVNDDGGYTSNQALPPFAPMLESPGRDPVPLPGVVVFQPDADGDGILDGATPPTVVRD
jgi:hypothetical protein